MTERLHSSPDDPFNSRIKLKATSFMTDPKFTIIFPIGHFMFPFRSPFDPFGVLRKVKWSVDDWYSKALANFCAVPSQCHISPSSSRCASHQSSEMSENTINHPCGYKTKNVDSQASREMNGANVASFCIFSNGYRSEKKRQTICLAIFLVSRYSLYAQNVSIPFVSARRRRAPKDSRDKKRRPARKKTQPLLD